jgi:hypothetical protein
MTDELRETCWNCDRPVWFCDIKHGIMEIAEGAAWGALTGAIVGLVLALLHNLC